jgi:ribosomal-protein-alanine N-acetyltransferase
MRGERLGPRHLDAVAPMLGDPRVAATMGGALDREQTAEHLAVADEDWARNGFGYWMWFDVATGAPVGRGGLGPAEFDGQRETEVGWLVTPERWGQGLATEMGGAAVEVAFGALGLDDVVAFTMTSNDASRRVMEKLGFTYEKTAPYKVYGDHALYRRRRGT